MNAVLKVSYLLIAFIICIFTACDQEGNEKSGSNIGIVKELPKMYFSPIDTEITAVINDLTEFDKFFQDKDSLEKYPEFETIDWSKHTLLLGYCSYKNQANIIHHFYQVDNQEYLYHVNISGYTSGNDNFVFGIIIDKLPENSKVIFEVEKEEANPFIVMELPKMYIDGLADGETKVINDSLSFSRCFTNDDLLKYPDLADINWNKHTLLVGRYFYVNQANLIHRFTKVDELNYLYRLKVSGNATATDNFVYGIVVEKLPLEANVTFKVVEDTYIEPGILIRELPKMDIENIKDKQTFVINDITEFNQYFTDKDLSKYPELCNIDWSIHTLLVGHYFYPYLVNIRHEFNKINNLDYIYNLAVTATAATAIDNFTYGIIVSKLPQEANVTFNIELEDPFMDMVELPKMDIKGLELEASKIINNKEEFNAVFSSDDIKHYPELNNINWDLYTLLVNRHVNSTLIVSYKHSFKKKASLNYLYLLEITSGDATAIDDFSYGLLVPKLPGNAIVEFIVKEVG